MQETPTSGESQADGQASVYAAVHLVRDRIQIMKERGASQREMLACLTSSAEALAGAGAAASILVIDSQGLLRNGASPNLPADYLNAIDRLKPDPNLGTCAAAAATGTPVFTPDFRADDRWAELRHLPLALGYSGAWSMPIMSHDGQVLGTFGTYYRDCRSPTPEEQAGIKVLAETAALVLADRLLS